jgi:hypothetical protein
MKSFIFVFAILFQAVGTASSQDDLYGKRDENRYEGIKPQRIQQVAQDRIHLLSFRAFADLTSTANTKTVSLSFFLQKGKRVKVSVFEMGENYYMDPLRHSWEAGLNSFSWPRAIIDRHRIPLEKLCAVAVVQERGLREICPIMVNSGGCPTSIQSYEFLLVPFRTMNIDWQITGMDSREIFSQGHVDLQPGNQPLLITWNGRNLKGLLVTEGTIQLQIKGSYTNPIGNLYSLQTGYTFCHKVRLSK